jgi:peptidoglycan hydrolase-like protein with peptidoglycan-binding domain
MTEPNFDLDFAIEQGLDEAQKFLDKLRKDKAKDIGDVRLLDALLRQIPVDPLPDRPIGAVPLQGLGLGIVQPGSRGSSDRSVISSNETTSRPSEARVVASEKQEAWNNVQALATKAGAKYPELVAAQWALESNFGKSLSGRNNFFGLKSTSGGTSKATQEEVNGQMITIDANFKDFDSLEDCVGELVHQWYKDFKDFKGVNRQPTREAAAKDLKVQGFATDSSYPAKLIGLMNQYAKDASDTVLRPSVLPEEGNAPASSQSFNVAAVTGDRIELQLNDGVTDRSPELKQEVVLLQRLLVDWHYLSATKVDGEFGQTTDKAVRDFQKDHGLEVDGGVGEFTWAALLKRDPSEVKVRKLIHTGGGQAQTNGANRIFKAAIELENSSTRGGPDGGVNACLWIVNKVLEKADVKPPWSLNEVSVPKARKALSDRKYRPVVQQLGAIAIMTDHHPTDPFPHIGICVDKGLILSNSSSKGRFAWKDIPAGYKKFYGGDVLYFLL